MKLLIVFSYLSSVLSLNILLSTTDSWVTKNLRLLYNDLLEQNHSVILVGPLYQTAQSLDATDGISSSDVLDGGDFGHLLPSNQIYYNNLKKLNDIGFMSSNYPKGVLKQREIDSLNEKYDETKLHEIQESNNNQFGFDPLDTNCAYVNTNNPINMLSAFLNTILPKHFSDFEIDLAIVGPTEGDSEKTIEVVNEMTKFLLVQNIPTISVVSADSNHVYFKNKSLNQQNNIFTKIKKFQNRKIINTINELNQRDILLPDFHSIQLLFPRYYNSNCKLHSVYRFADEDRLLKLNFSEFSLVDNKLINTNTKQLNLQKKQEIMDLREGKAIESVDDDESVFVDKMSNYYQHKMKLLNIEPNKMSQNRHKDDKAFSNCDITVKVQYLFNLDSNWDPSDVI